MKHIIPSSFWHDISSKLQQIIPAKLQNLIPDKYRKWLPLALAMVLVVFLACCFHSCSSGESTEPILCTVSVDGLNVHKEHDADSSVQGLLPMDMEIQILERVTADSIEWGRIEKTKLPDGSKVKGGWINLEYVRFPGEPDPEVIETMPPEPETEPVAVLPDPELGTTVMGTITAGKLNIREGAGSEYEAIDAYLEGDRVEILETKIVDDTLWGRTSKGWIGMGYVKLDGTAPSGSSEDGNSTSPDIVSDGAFTVLGYGVVDLGSLNVRSGPGTGYDKVSTVSEGTRYAFYQAIDDWVRIEGGWVSMDYFYIEGTTADDAATVTIVVEELNIRTGPSTSFKSVGAYKQGESVEILAQVHGWGYTSQGWISMANVELAEPTYSTGTGTVTSGLNIRKEPNADSEIVDTYKEGEKVTITEVNGSWGKTEKGWINLKYVTFD